MPALAIRPGASVAARPALRTSVADPAYALLKLVAGSFVFLGAESTATIGSVLLTPITPSPTGA